MAAGTLVAVRSFQSRSTRVLVAVDAAYLHGLAVEAQLSVADVDVAEAYALGDALGFAARGIAEGDDKIVECGSGIGPRLYAGMVRLVHCEPVAIVEFYTMPGAVDGEAVEGKQVERHRAAVNLAVEVHHHVKAAGAPVVGVEVGDDFYVGNVG